MNVADPLSRHPAFEATTALSSITLDLSCLTLSSVNGAMLSAVMTCSRTAPPPSPAAQHTRTNMLDSTAPAAAQHTCTDMSDSSVPATVPAVTDHIVADVAAENAAAATADADMLSQLIRGYSVDSWFASVRNTATLDIYQGLYYRGDALVIPDIPELKRSIMQELHGANSKQPWDHVTMYRILSLPKTKKGHTAILVVVDKLTKMAHFAPCKNECTARELASEYYRSVWKLHGVPLRMTTDRGSEFVNKFSAALCELVGTVHSRSTAYHPQSDGQTERMNRVLKDMLRHYVNPKQDNWDDLLPAAEFAVNNAFQESI